MQKLIIYFLFLATGPIYGQYNGLDLLGGKQEIEIKFRFENGLIVLPIFYNDFLPVNFIFDTGAEHTILFRKSINDIMGLPYERRITIRGADLQDSMFALITRNVPITINDDIKVERDIVVLEEDRLKIEQVTGFKIDGILGASFFKNLVIHIDFRRKKIKLFDPNYFTPEKLKGYQKFPIEIISNKPYIRSSTFNGITSKDQKLLIDSGSSIPFILHYEKDSNLILPEKVITGKLGVGLGGNMIGIIGRIDQLKLGDFTFHNVITHFQKIDYGRVDSTELIRTGLLGTPILSRFEVCIDYLREDLYLRPNKDYNKEFKYDRSGLSIFAFGPNFNNFYVKNIVPNSPAAEAGIQVGDIITKIGFWKSSWYSLERITNKLKGKQGESIKLSVRRKDQEIKVEFQLRELFTKMSFK